MITLDEVIDKLIECHTRWCRWSETSDIVERDAVEEAICYLREYRDKAHRLDIDIADHRRSFEQLVIEIERYQEAVKNCEEAENKYRQLAQNLGEVGNPPLDWDELKQMTGKPVWIEHLETGTPHGEWTIVQTPAVFGDVYLVTRYRDRYVLYEKDLGETWQAYRKERKQNGQQKN